MAQGASREEPHDEEAEKKPAKARREIPLVSVPGEDDRIEEEMADLFEEDQVTHKHGTSEPEGD